MYYTIYKITNKLDGKFYIGKHKTKNLDDDYMGSGTLIRRAIKKHGIENFLKEILLVFDNEEEMNEAEKQMVVLCEDSYNLCPGGKGGWGYLNDGSEKQIARCRNGRKASNEVIFRKYGVDNPTKIISVRKVLSEKAKKRWESGDLNPPPSWKGKKHKTESKRLIGEKNSISQTGSNNSQYGTRWITDGHINKKLKKEEPIPIGWVAGRA